MERRYFLADITEVKQLEGGKKVYTGVATKRIVDRVGTIVEPRGIVNLDEYRRNPVLLWQHDVDKPIGRITDIRITDDAIEVDFVFASTQLANEIQQLVDEKVLNSLSIGFVPVKDEIENGFRVFKQWLWLETSIVTLPANPEAVITIRGIVPDDDAEFPVYEDLEREWSADESEVRWRKYVGVETNDDLQDKEKQRRYAKRFFWMDDEKPENFGSYKLPHVDVINGKPYAIWRGVVAAMAALLGARGGVDIPEADKEKVYKAIAKYYRKVGKEPPEFHRNYTPEELELIAEGYNPDEVYGLLQRLEVATRRLRR